MGARTVKTRTTVVELGAGRRLSVCRFTDPATGRDVVTLAEGWPEDGTPLPGRRGDALEVPGDALGELIQALRELED